MGLLEVEVTLGHPFIMMMDFILQVIQTLTVPQAVDLDQEMVLIQVGVQGQVRVIMVLYKETAMVVL